MDFKGWNSFGDLARACGYSNSENTSETSNDNATNESCDMGCSDIPNGFQSLNPQLFVVIGEILGNIIAGSIPYNVQNALGNWLELVGQAILTYNAQQQYFQGGPGRYFNPKYYNVSNPFCNTTSQSDMQNSSSKKEKKTSSEKEVCKIKELELRIDELKNEMERLKNKMDK